MFRRAELVLARTDATNAFQNARNGLDPAMVSLLARLTLLDLSMGARPMAAVDAAAVLRVCSSLKQLATPDVREEGISGAPSHKCCSNGLSATAACSMLLQCGCSRAHHECCWLVFLDFITQMPLGFATNDAAWITPQKPRTGGCLSTGVAASTRAAAILPEQPADCGTPF